jgi:hypothetical protein
MSDDRTDLMRLLPDPARHELPEDRHRQLKEQFLHQLNDPPKARPRRARLAFRIATAVAAVVVVALGAVSVLGFGVGKFWAGQTEAGDLLERIALVAANSTDIPPADQVRDDQYEYIETYGGYGGLNITVDGNGHETAQPVPLDLRQRQIWKSVDGKRPGLVRDGRLSSDDVVLDVSGDVYLNNPTFRYLASLPTNPDVLLAKIYLETWGAGSGPQAEAFVTIGDMMRESIVPANLAEGLYKAAARIPGITVVDDATDALGRHGIAIARTDGIARTEWIFDKTSLQFLGERSVLTEAMGPVPAGTVTASTAIVVRAIVDRAGQEPPS